MGFCVAHHSLYITFIKGRSTGNGNGLFFARRLLLGRHRQQSIGIKVKRDFNFGNATRCDRNPIEPKGAKVFIIIGKFPFSLHHMNFDIGLGIGSSRKHLGFFDWNSGVAGNYFRHNATHRFHAQRQRCHVKQDNILDIPSQHAALNRRAHRHHFIRIDPLVRIFTRNQPNELLDRWNSARATD